MSESTVTPASASASAFALADKGEQTCNYCHATPPKETAPADSSTARAPLLFCSRCRAVGYCSKEHQKADWKTHKSVCIPAAVPPTATAAATRAAASNSASPLASSNLPQRSISSSPFTISSVPFSSPSLSTAVGDSAGTVASLPNLSWCDVIFDRCCELRDESADLMANEQPTKAIPLLTHALYLHAALSPDYPKSILHLLYAQRSIAYLNIPPASSALVYLAIYDALTSIKVNRAYVHGYGLAYNAWRAAGRIDKAREAATHGQRAAISTNDEILRVRFEGMIAKLEDEETKKIQPQEEEKTDTNKCKKKKKKNKNKSLQQPAVDQAEGTTTALSPSTASSSPASISTASTDRYSQLLIEAKNLRANESTATKAAWNKFDSAVKSSVAQTLYHTPSLTLLQSLFPSSPPYYLSLSQSFSLHSSYFSQLVSNKALQVSYSPQLGRHLLATRHYNAGEIIVKDTVPPFISTVQTAHCGSCLKQLDFDSRDQYKCLNGISCVNDCRHEFYCSAVCRDRAWLRWHQWLCGHQLRELRERSREAVTGSAKTYLLLAQAMGVTMGVVKEIEREIRREAVRIATKKERERQEAVKTEVEGEKKAATVEKAIQPADGEKKEQITMNGHSGNDPVAATPLSTSPSSTTGVSPPSLLPPNPFHLPFNLLSYLPPSLSYLQSSTDLPPSFLCRTSQHFDRQWAMLTLMTHWLILTPAHRAGDVESEINAVSQSLAATTISSGATDSESTATTATGSTLLLPSYSSAAAQSFLSYFDYYLFDTLHSKLLLNSFSLQSPTDEPHFASVGGSIVGCSVLTSLFSHSCFPNCQLVSDVRECKGGLIVRSSRAVKKGEVLSVSYIDDAVLKGKKNSRAEALLSYGFKCLCSRCVREKLDEKEETELREFYSQHGLA